MTTPEHQKALDKITMLESVIDEMKECLEFYKNKDGTNFKPIFEDENSTRINIYESYKKYSIGDLGVNAIKTLASVENKLKDIK